jgi:hypothetical protein
VTQRKSAGGSWFLHNISVEKLRFRSIGRDVWRPVVLVADPRSGCERKHMVRITVLATALLSTVAPLALAQVPPQPPPVSGTPLQGTEQERAACHPDVVKFCHELVRDDNNSDVFGILACLQDHRSRLSKACGEVLASHGQ